jgi:hypothetical protein
VIALSVVIRSSKVSAAVPTVVSLSQAFQTMAILLRMKKIAKPGILQPLTDTVNSTSCSLSQEMKLYMLIFFKDSG